MDALSVIKDHGIIPVLGLKDPETAPQVAAALRAGGLPLLEVTMRAPLAMDCLKAIKAADPDMLVRGPFCTPSRWTRPRPPGQTLSSPPASIPPW